MWFVISWADVLGYEDMSFELASDGTPRMWKNESSAKRWAAKNCAFNFQIIYVD
jgi:hypothetical protein